MPSQEPTEDDQVLLVDTTDRVRTLTLNRPQSRNALSSALRTRFYAALAEADADEGVDVVILTGADPVFCAGLDLKELGDTTALPDISPKWPAMGTPVIGAINGAAVTGGLELALYCDILIASENARFADTHARVGLLPTWGLSVRLPQKVGIGLARRMSLTGDYLSAAGRAAGRPGHRGGRARRPAACGPRRRRLDRRQQPARGAGAAGVLPPHRRAADQCRAVDRGRVGDAVDERGHRRRHRRQPGGRAGTRKGAGALTMNEAHEMCGSDEWRQAMRDVILPWALGDTDLGDDVLEVGPGYGACTDVLSQAVPKLTSVEIDTELAAMLRERFADVPTVEIVNADATTLDYADGSFTGAACFTMLHHVPTEELQDRLFGEIARVLRPGAALVASDSLGSDELAAHHTDDTYNPVDPESLPERLAAAGFIDVEVRTNPYGWAVVARKA